MPDLLSRARTPLHLAQLAQCLPRRCLPQVRRRHDLPAHTEDTPPNSTTETQSTVSGDGQLMRSRKYGFRSLPLSPLMREHKPRKRLGRDRASDEGLAEFQKEVAMNPFAQALATPIRRCTVTLAHLPSHFLLPFTTVIERPPPTSEGQPSKIKAHIKPGLRSEHPEESLGQLSYVINRQDVVRHLSRRKNWTNLVTDRQRGKGASIAHRSPNAQRLLQDYWVWDDKAVEAAAVLLENRVKAALEDAIEAMKADGLSTMAREEQPAFVLALAASRPGDETGEVRSKPEVPFYDLPDLLSAEILDGLKEDYSLSDTVYVPKSPKALRAQLALEKLKAHKESSGSMKQLP